MREKLTFEQTNRTERLVLAWYKTQYGNSNTGAGYKLDNKK